MTDATHHTHRSFILSALLSCAIILVACARSAPPAPAAAAAAPAPTVPEQLRFFVGAWEGKNRSANGRVTTLSWQVAPTLGGRWLAGQARVAEAGVEARDFLGVQAGQIVRVYVDSQGTRATMTSPGWQGTGMTWEGEAHGADGSTVRVRELIEKVDERTMRARWESWTDGAWALMSEETLKKP
jgi:hypothetical protein